VSSFRRLAAGIARQSEGVSSSERWRRRATGCTVPAARWAVVSQTATYAADNAAWRSVGAPRGTQNASARQHAPFKKQGGGKAIQAPAALCAELIIESPALLSTTPRVRAGNLPRERCLPNDSLHEPRVRETTPFVREQEQRGRAAGMR